MEEQNTPAISGEYYWVKPFEKDEFEPAKCSESYDNNLYFFFTDGSRMGVKRVWEFKPLKFK